MNLFILFTLLISATSSNANVFNYREVIECVTGMSPFKFLNYGCNCDLTPSGPPVDDIDRCCKEHAQCYESCSSTGCPSMNLMHSYTFQCDATRKTASLTSSGTCQQCAFNCDLTASQCFNKNFNTYNKAKAICQSDSMKRAFQGLNGTPFVETLENVGNDMIKGATSFFEKAGNDMLQGATSLFEKAADSFMGGMAAHGRR